MKTSRYNFIKSLTEMNNNSFVSVFIFIVFAIFSLGVSFTAQADTIITNTAIASFSINGTNNSVSDSVQFVKNTVITPPDEISIQKQASTESAFSGDTLTYTLIVSNPNSHAQKNIKITDILPSGLVFKPGTVKLNNVLLDNNKIQLSGNRLLITLDEIPANSEANLTYQVTASSTGILINQAYVQSDSANSSTAKAIVSIATRPPVKPAIKPLVLTKKADKTRAKLGDIIHYTLSITNDNATSIKNSQINDSLPTELSYITNSALLDGKTIATKTDNGLSFPIGTIAPHSIRTLEYDAKLISTNKSRLTNIATVTADQVAASSNTASASINVSNDIITLDKSVNKQTTKAGDTLVYTIHVANPQAHALSNLILNDVLPTGFTYKPGTAYINGTLLSDAQVSIDASKLDFSIGNIEKNNNITLSYEVVVTDQAVPGEAINTVSANSDYALSPSVSSSIKVRTPSTIKFLKINPSSEEGKHLIPLTSYNDNKNGGKHWETLTNIKLRNGDIIDFSKPQSLLNTDQYTISDPVVIQVTDKDQNTDPNTVETIIVIVTVPGTNDKEVLLLRETSKDSGIFIGILPTTSAPAKKQNGTLSLVQGSEIRVSYYDETDQTDINARAALVIPDTQLVLIKTSNKQSASIGELVKYTLNFKNTTDFVIPNLVIKDTLPIGFTLVKNSSVLNTTKTVSNINNNGRELTFNLGLMKPGEDWSLDYLTKVNTNVQIGDAINTAHIDSDKFTSNSARSKIVIKDDLMISKNILSGRVYIGCTKKGKEVKVLKDARIYLETGRNVLSDHQGFWHMEGINPGKHVLQLDTNSLSDNYEQILCTENTRYAKNTKTRFVDLKAGSLWQVDFHVKKTNSIKSINKIIKTEVSNPAQLFTSKYLESSTGEFEILWPKNNYVPAVASTKIYIKSAPKYKVDVFLNGKPVSALNYDGSDTNKARTATIRRWFGVDIDINKRNNMLLAILKDKSGKEIARKTHSIHFSSKPNTAEFLEDQSILIADGKTTPVITLRIKDEDGFPMRANTHGYFTLKNSPYSIKTQSDNNGDLNLNESLSGSYKYQIEEGGITHIELNPTTQSGEIQLELKFSKSNQKTITTWLKPQLRDWILVGLAEGTVAYKTVSGNLKTLNDLDKTDKFYKRGRIAFFAKGKIKGKYLLTLAYDSHKKKQEAGSQLQGDINPDAWYTIYADNSHSQYDAPSSRKLYIKLERNTFYTVFGDYRTGMNITELARFERTLNGVKSEYKGKNISYNAFVSETSNNHHHDEIPGDGTSGLYQLSASIIPNSETIRIETRDRFHSERILETRDLVRYQDYDIDYDAGTLFFKFPVTGRDSNFDPNIIVVDYDSETDTSKNIIAGGRLAINTTNKKLSVGISAINLENTVGKNDSLVAIDSTFKINNTTKIHAEVAQSKTKANNYEATSAQIIKLEKEISNLEAKIYYRKQESNFGIDSQTSEIGTKKLGAELKYKINNNTNVSAEVSKQTNLSNDNKRQLAEIKLNHRANQFETNAGLRHSKEYLAGKTQTNNTVLVGGRYTTKNGKVALRSSIEKNINNKNDSELNPDRATVGIDIKLKQGITLFAEHEITKTNNTKTQNSRIGVTKNLWKGAKGRTTITQERTDQGQRNYATLGLSQRIKLTNKISADISLDHAKTIGNNIKRFNEKEPTRQGSQREDYTAFTVGLGANEKQWSWSTRAEVRNGSVTDKINFRAGLIRHLSDGKNLSAKINYSDSKNTNGDYATTTRLSLGSAWHPKEKEFVFFSRLDLIDEKNSNNSELTHTQKIIHNLHYNRKINDKTQISLHHGIKHIVNQDNQIKTRATVDTATLELRKDISERWDIGAHVGYIHDWTDNKTSAVAGVSVGVTPAKNAWLQVGYNFEGFDDEDFDGNDYKRKGAYLSFSYKFDQDGIRRKNKKITQRLQNKK